MLIFLYGPDDYRRVQKKRELIAEFKKKRSDLGLRFFDLAAKDWKDGFDEFTRSESLFEPARLAVFENAFEEFEAATLAKILKPFAGVAANDKKSRHKAADALTILLSEHDKPLKALAFLLEKPTITQKFENLEGAEWLSFIAGEAKKLGLRLGMPAAQFLATVYAGNSWALATELQKLSTLKSTIEKKDLDSFDLEAAPNYWAFLNGMKSYHIKNRLFALEKLLATNDPPAKLFNILASQWKEKIPQFAEFDFDIKSGKLEYEEALVDLVIS